MIRGECKDQTTSDSNEVDQVQLDSLWKVKDELTVNSATNLILRGSRIVIPISLKLLREKVWFPRIDKKVAQMIDECIACQANSQENRPQPLHCLQQHGTLCM